MHLRDPWESATYDYAGRKYGSVQSVKGNEHEIYKSILQYICVYAWIGRFARISLSIYIYMYICMCVCMYDFAIRGRGASCHVDGMAPKRSARTSMHPCFRPCMYVFMCVCI